MESKAGSIVAGIVFLPVLGCCGLFTVVSLFMDVDENEEPVVKESVEKSVPDRPQDGPAFKIVEHKEGVLDKESVVVVLEERVDDAAQIHAISRWVRETKAPDADPLFFTYYLDGDDRQAMMAYASQKIAPGAGTVTLHGVTKENVDRLYAPEGAYEDAEVIGRWWHAMRTLGEVVVYRKDDAVFMDTYQSKGATLTDEIELYEEYGLTHFDTDDGDYALTVTDNLEVTYDSGETDTFEALED